MPSLALSLGFSTITLALLGDDAILNEWLDQLSAVVTEHNIPVYRASGPLLRGWVQVKNGNVKEGISLLRSGSAAYRATGQQASASAGGAPGGYTGTPAGQAAALNPDLKKALEQFNRTGNIEDALRALDIVGQQERLRDASRGGGAMPQPQGRDW